MERTVIVDAIRRLAIRLLVLCLSFGPVAQVVSPCWLEPAGSEPVSVSLEAPEPASAPIVADAAKNAFAASTSVPQCATALSWRGFAQGDSHSTLPFAGAAPSYSAEVCPTDPSRAPPHLI